MSQTAQTEVRMELMRPGQIDQAKRKRPAVYAAFGSVEWHGRQSPLGVDTLYAHELLLRLAREVGGVVYPPTFFGSGGGHIGYPYTCMCDPAPVRQCVENLLAQFERDGFRDVILLGGHGPNPEEYLAPAVRSYYEHKGTMRVLVFGVWQLKAWPPLSHHGGMYETSLMMYLHPQSVDLTQLAGHDEDITGPDIKRDWLGPQHKDHPCWGIIEPDPRRNSSAKVGEEAMKLPLPTLKRWLDGKDISQELKWRYDDKYGYNSDSRSVKAM